MTIPKRLKRKRGGYKLPPPVNPQEVQKVEEIMKKLEKMERPETDKMVRNYPRLCPKCQKETYSTLCHCGRLTIVTK